MDEKNRPLGADDRVINPFGTKTSRSPRAGSPRHLTADPGPGGRFVPADAARDALDAGADAHGVRE